MSRSLSLSMLAAAVLSAAGGTGASAATPAGTLMVLQINGTTANATSVSLQEFHAAGFSGASTPFNTISVTSTGANALTLPGGASRHDGLLRLSGDGNYVTFGGYRADAGAANPSLALASTVNRAIGSFNLNTETLDTTQAVNDSFNFTTIDAVVTQNGSQYWIGGGLGFTTSGLTTWDTSGGIRYVPNTSTNTTVNIGMNQTLPLTNGLRPDELRSLFISGGQLYMTTPAQNSYHVNGPSGQEQQRGTYQVGSGLPTVAPGPFVPLLTNTPGAEPGQELFNDPSGTFAAKSDAYFLDLNPAIPGNDTAYGTGGKLEFEKWSKYYDSALSIYRWHMVSATVTSSLTGELNSLLPVVRDDGITVDIYATSDSRLNHFVDTTGYIDPGYPTFASLPTVFSNYSGPYDFVAAPAGTVFRGLAAVPEPASLSLLAVGAAALVMRRKRN